MLCGHTLSMDGTDKKTPPADGLGEKAAEAYRKADPDGIVTDPDGSWTGFPRFDPPPRNTREGCGPDAVGSDTAWGGERTVSKPRDGGASRTGRG